MFSIHRWAIATAAMGFAACLVAGCGGKEESPKAATAPAAAPAPKKAIVPEKRPQIVRGDEGEIRYSGETESGESFEAQLGGKVTLPKSFPEDIPVYPNSVPFSSMETGGGTAIVSLDVEAKPSDVYSFYKEKLAAAGWKLQNELNIGGGRAVTAIKGDRKAVLNVESTEKGTRFGFMFGPAS